MLRSVVTRGLTIALAASLATIPLAGRAADPFEINAIVSLTGSAAFLGKAQSQALNILQNQVNRAGGINGRPIAFTIADDESNPQVGVQLMNAVIAKKAQVVIGASIVAVCNAIAPLAANGPVDYCLSPGVHPPQGSYIFSALPSTDDAFIASVVYFRAKGWHKIALITSSDATGQDAERGIGALFTPQNGMEIVAHEHFNITDVSVAAQIAHVKASGAQAIIAWSTGTPIATILRGIQDAGVDLPIEVSNGNVTFAQMHAYASFMPKDLLFATTAPIAPDELPGGAVRRKAYEYINAFQATGIRPDTGYVAAWDPAVIVVEAYKKLGLGATAAQIREYIAGLRGWVGILGEYDNHAIPQRGVGPNNVVMVRWDPAKDTFVGVSKLGGEPVK
jgi:branched-chain amino acid transport system substrate-binding protein